MFQRGHSKKAGTSRERCQFAPRLRGSARTCGRAGARRHRGPVVLSLTLLATICHPAFATGAQSSPAAEACAGCHSANKREPGALRDLSVLTSAAIVEAMAGFRAGQPDNPVMSLIARAYSEAETEALARELGRAADGQAHD